MAAFSSKKKFQVFDFTVEDERAEKAAAEFGGKFGVSRKNHRRSSPVDKYNFLRHFAQGTKPQQKEISCEPIDVDAEDAQGAKPGQVEISNEPFIEDVGVAQRDKAHQKENMEKLIDVDVCGMDNHSTCSVSYPKGMQRKDGSLRQHAMSDTSLLPSSCNNENGQITVISDDDDFIEKSSSASSCSLLDNEVSLEEWVVERGKCGGHEIDIVNNSVVVSPDFLLYADMYCTDSRITFSCSSVKVESLNVNGTKGSLSCEWTIGDIIKIQSELLARVETAFVNLTLKSKNSIGAETANEIPGVELLNFAVYDPHWSRGQEAIQLLDFRYKDIWNATFDDDGENEANTSSSEKSKLVSERHLFKFDEPFKNVVYPKDDPDAVVISKRDVELLQPEIFINDTIIDFYIKYLKNKIPPGKQHRFHFFNSFFFRKLADLDKDPSSACEVKAAFQRVRKWTKNVNLFEKDYIFIPVNYSLHWSLIVICHPGEVIYFQDEEIGKTPKVPCILHMNSIRGSHRGLKKLLQSYLYEEWKERHGITEDDIPSKFLGLQFLPLELPQQENSFDCGLFLLHYAELFLEEAPFSFNPCKIIGFSKFLNRNWFPPAEASLKRGLIKKLIYEICEDHSNEDPSADYIDECTSQLTPDKDERETGKVIPGQISTPTKIYRQGYSSNSDVEKEIEISVLGAFPQRVVHGATDPAFICGEQHHQITTCHQRSILSPIQEAEETDEQMAHTPSTLKHWQQVGGPANESSTLHIWKDFRLLQKVSSDQQFSLHFKEHDESAGEHQNAPEEEVEEHQVLAEFKGPKYRETTDKPEASSTGIGELAVFIVKDFKEESALVIEDSEEENEELASLVIEDSEGENELASLVIAESQGENELAALVVDDSQEVNSTQDGCENKNSRSSLKDIYTLSLQGADLTENNHLRENQMPINIEDIMSDSEADERKVAKRLRLIHHEDGEQLTRSTAKELLS